jgi:ABC-type lipoprotein export system ATPase subunit
MGLLRDLVGAAVPARNEDAGLVKNEGMQEKIIELRGVEKSYPQGGGQVYVLRRVDVVIEEGEFVSVMGPSGAGKSTLLHILGMHDSEFTGEYYLLGEPVHKLGRKQRHELQKRAIGFVFQSYHLLDELTVAENLELPLSYRNLKKSEREAIVADTLDRFQIVGKKDLYPRQLSGGQQQLVAVARAIVANPKLILADEPTGNLPLGAGRRDHAAVPEAERRGAPRSSR